MNEKRAAFMYLTPFRSGDERKKFRFPGFQNRHKPEKWTKENSQSHVNVLVLGTQEIYQHRGDDTCLVLTIHQKFVDGEERGTLVNISAPCHWDYISSLKSGEFDSPTVHHSLLQNIDGMSFNNQKGDTQCIALSFFSFKSGDWVVRVLWSGI